MPLSVLQGDADPGGRWCPRDRDLAVALTEYEASLCPHCGYPRDVCHDPWLRYSWQSKGLPERCNAATESARARRGYEQNEHPEFLHFPLDLIEEGWDYLSGDAPGPEGV